MRALASLSAQIVDDENSRVTIALLRAHSLLEIAGRAIQRDEGKCGVDRTTANSQSNGSADSHTEMTSAAISVAYKGRLLPEVLMRLGACCALFSLSCAPLCAIGPNAAGHSGNWTANAD